jgi:hypothetical protein
MEAMGTRGRQGEKRKCVDTVPLFEVDSQSMKALTGERELTGEIAHVPRLVDREPGIQGVGEHF